MTQSYNASDIEVLSGLDPVRRRPGMYTDTTRPNHLAQEVIDNSRRRGAGRPRQGDRGRPAQGRLAARWPTTAAACRWTSIPKEKVTRRRADPHAPARGRQVQRQELQVLRRPARRRRVAWSTRCRSSSKCWIKRDGKEYNMSFKDGDRARSSKWSAPSASSNTGTTVRFWPDPKYFDTPQVLRAAAQAHAARQGRAVPGLARHAVRRGHRRDATSGTTTDGLRDYLRGELGEGERAAARAVHRQARRQGQRGRRLGAGLGAATASSSQESYVNLIPTAQGGTHVNGLRSGLDRCAARVLRVPQPAAARHQARAGRRVGRRAASCCR